MLISKTKREKNPGARGKFLPYLKDTDIKSTFYGMKKKKLKHHIITQYLFKRRTHAVETMKKTL